MARGVNKVILVGNLGDDPETTYTRNEKAVCRIRLATTAVWKDDKGNKQERTEWHRCVAFGKAGEIIDEYAEKGSQLYIEGHIRYDKYEKDGITRYTTDIIIDEFQFLGGGGNRDRRDDRDDREERRSSRSEKPRKQDKDPLPSERDDNEAQFEDDDIPF